jgi:hypothetical protein
MWKLTLGYHSDFLACLYCKVQSLNKRAKNKEIVEYG